MYHYLGIRHLQTRWILGLLLGVTPLSWASGQLLTNKMTSPSALPVLPVNSLLETPLPTTPNLEVPIVISASPAAVPSGSYNFHVCVANAVYDNSLGSLNLILRFQRKDLAEALNRHFSRQNMRVEDAEKDPKPLMDYLSSTLRLLDENYIATPMTYIGQAMEGDVVAIFVEAKLFKPETMLILFDSLMELYDEQYNIINISMQEGGRQYSKVFRKGQETQRFSE